MARRNGNRGRGRNRGGGAYARPIVEPCNFVEVDIAVNSLSGEAVTITWSQVWTALAAYVQPTQINKFRVTSVAFDQVNTASGGGLKSADIQMGITGLEYQWPNVNRMLKIRLGKDYGDDGMWIVNEGSAPTDACFPGVKTATDPFFTLSAGSGSEAYGTSANVRIAWQDPT